MNWRKMLSGAAGIAATAAATAVNPALGAVVGSAFAAGAGAKLAGKAVEKRTGIRVHKAGAPVAAVAGAGLAGNLVDPNALCTAVEAVCGNPAVMGLLAVGAHQLWTGVLKMAKRRE